MNEVQREIVAVGRASAWPGGAAMMRAERLRSSELAGVRGPPGRRRPSPAPDPVNQADDPPLGRGDRRRATRSTLDAEAAGRSRCTAGSSPRRRCCRRGRCGASSPGPRRGGSAQDELMRLLDERRLHVGRRHQLRAGVPALPAPRRPPRRSRAIIESVSPTRRRPALGVGHFVTTRDRVPRPATASSSARCASASSSSARRQARRRATRSRPRPRPAITHDNAFWFEGAKRAQAAHPAVRVVRHAAPPAPARCARRAARSSGTRVEASGRGTVYSFVVNHYPQVPAFDYPLADRRSSSSRRAPAWSSNVVGVEPDDVDDRHGGRGRVRRPRRRADAARLPAGGAS